jgi:hypothetical protein
MDLSATDRPLGRPLNPAFRAFTAASTPASTPVEVVTAVLPGARASSTLSERVREGRETLAELTVDRRFEQFALGFCGLLSGRTVA